MTESKKLFYQAKSLDTTLTAERIAENLNNRGIKQEKTYTKYMVSNMLAGRNFDENIFNELKKISKTTPQNA